MTGQTLPMPQCRYKEEWTVDECAFVCLDVRLLGGLDQLSRFENGSLLELVQLSIVMRCVEKETGVELDGSCNVLCVFGFGLVEERQLCGQLCCSANVVVGLEGLGRGEEGRHELLLLKGQAQGSSTALHFSISLYSSIPAFQHSSIPVFQYSSIPAFQNSLEFQLHK
jgi:hypothetical protein